MQIIFGDNVNLVRERFTVLELDTFYIASQDQTVTAWCAIESIPIEEVHMTESLVNLHHDLMAQYRQQNWSFCLQAIAHLKGRWNGEVDSFYDDLTGRIQIAANQPSDIQWTWLRALPATEPL